MSALGSTGLTILSFALVISAVVFFHELGHLIVGKLVGVKAIRFSIGFGPDRLRPEGLRVQAR
jgi:regulator of sigma E protease